jgi:hypothetical protein
MRRRSTRLLIACIAGVPILTWFVRTAQSVRRKKRGVAPKRAFTADSVEDFTPEQTAVLGRVREIWDAETAGEVSPGAQHSLTSSASGN